MAVTTDNSSHDLLATLTADIVSAHVGNNSVGVSDIANLIANVHGALSALTKQAVPVEEPLQPAVSIRSSIKPDHIICLEDGKALKMLKRHLMTHYQMTPADYRAKWKLPPDYPMVAPDYAEKRRALAKKIGLGRKRKTEAAPAAVVTSTPKRKPRVRKVALEPAG